jgi:hypothetical protein
MALLELSGNEVVGVPLIPRDAGVSVEVVAYGGDGFHFFVC